MAGAPVGGAESFFLDALTALQETGKVQQQVVTRANNPDRLHHLETLNIPCRTASFNRHVPCATQQTLRRALNTFCPDIAHYWLGRAASFAQEKGSHVNVGWYGAYYHPKYYKHCRHHIAVTQDVADHIISHGIAAKYVHVLHLYSDCPEAPPLDRAAFDTPDDAPLLLSLARLHPVKGLDTLLKALVKIPEAYLWLAGSGPLERDLKQLCTDLGLDGRVRFLGWRQDRAALLATADLCVFPSRNDSFGAVMLEAWASRTPLVATKAPGPRAYIRDGETGLLVEIDDVDALAEAVSRVLTDSSLRQTLIEGGVRTYRENFTKEVFKTNILSLYDQILRE